jgi:GTP-binding protein EngB required for normal cell division
MTTGADGKPGYGRNGHAATSTRGPLREYDKVKLELAGLVREVKAQAGADEHVRAECEELLARLAEDRFNVAVVGRFSRGKTSLMNAVLGTDRLPTGILPLTSVITIVCYGSSERALVYHEPRSFPYEISMDRIPDYVTQEGNPGNRKGVHHVEMQIPAETLRRGFVFVDTPGLGSTIAANTAITAEFFPEMDAVVVVTSFEAVLSAEEIEFLRTAVQGGRKTFLVINKLDLVNEEERDKVSRYVEDKLADVEGAAGIGTFAVSARDGLHAKRENDVRKLLNSGLPEFEQELVRFLTSGKTEQVLALTCRRLLDVVVGRGISSLAAIPSRIRRILGTVQTQAGQESKCGVTVSSAALLPTERVRLERSCQICAEMVTQVLDFLSRRQYRLSNSREARSAHVASGGFCRIHTWQYEELASPYGVSTAYGELLETLAHQLRSLASHAASAGNLTSSIARLATSSPTCAACRSQASAEGEALSRLSAKLLEAGNGELPQLPLLCLAHFRALLTRITDSELARKLAEQQASVCERISENMQRAALKHETRLRALQSEEEKRAHLQALMIVAGHRRAVSEHTENT